MNGSRIRQYRLEDELGRGPHGIVHRATDGATAVAAKVIHPMLASDAGFLEALRREHAKILAVGSAGSIRARELVEEDGRVALVTDLADGRPLSEVSAPMDAAQALATLRGALETLGECHARGLVHANLKPSNVWVVGGKIVLSDAGLSRAADHVPGARQLGADLDFTPPEAFQGRREAPGDVYALGQIAWMLLVGRPACPPGSEPLKMAWHLTTGAPDVLEERPDVPLWLADLVGRMVALDPVQRPRDALKALEMLETLSGRPQTRPASSTFTPPVGPPRDTPTGATRKAFDRAKWQPERDTWTDLAPERDGSGPSTPTMDAPRVAPVAPAAPVAAQEAAASSGWAWGLAAMALVLLVVAAAVALL